MKTPATLAQRMILALTARAAPRHWRTILVLLLLAVSYLALTPKPPVHIDTGWDKLNHLLAFAALAFAGGLGFSQSRDRQTFLLLALLAYGGLVEVLQLYVPGRAGEWADLLADTIGIACGAVTAAYVLRVAATRPVR